MGTYISHKGVRPTRNAPFPGTSKRNAQRAIESARALWSGHRGLPAAIDGRVYQLIQRAQSALRSGAYSDADDLAYDTVSYITDSVFKQGAK